MSPDERYMHRMCEGVHVLCGRKKGLDVWKENHKRRSQRKGASNTTDDRAHPGLHIQTATEGGGHQRIVQHLAPLLALGKAGEDTASHGGQLRNIGGDPLPPSTPQHSRYSLTSFSHHNINHQRTGGRGSKEGGMAFQDSLSSHQTHERCWGSDCGWHQGCSCHRFGGDRWTIGTQFG